ncbi:Nif3-like dinuclear metal center hexameric protein [Iningainema tapete]|uniref:GTP cyclohydrolase 1 type 2 homolog n=1 Tax=Iningainema tapete BLCC-T55 TaxID=2748662 RepID=A0A8J6XSD3_9CYAN|nr:Nif3-like dinuclear metal center hexameric protein [Iningainema tapete]MBD2778692.1 Nif3-like dinuclear metal center hexameric protein [Iningainema tapete BLCC-T55]
MKIADLIAWFEAWANPSWQESWDNCGWQIEPGVLQQDARVLVCLTPTLAVMHEAIALQNAGTSVNLIFAHHPLIFHPLKSLCSGEAIAEMARLAFTHNIGIYTAHTNFDQVQDGTADVLAQILQLTDVTPIVPTQSGLGYGRVGNLSPLTLQNFLAVIQTKLAPPNLIFSPTANLQQRISRVAVLGGSGASFISAVVKTGEVDAYLTSDCKFHQFQESRDQQLVLIDAGHYATERPACERLVQKFRSLNLTWVNLSQKDEDFRQFFTI